MVNSLVQQDIDQFEAQGFNFVMHERLDQVLFLLTEELKSYAEQSEGRIRISDFIENECESEITHGYYSPFLEEMDLHYAWHEHYNSMDHYPEPESEEWFEGGYSHLFHDTLIHGWDAIDGIKDEYIAETRLLFELLHFAYAPEKPGLEEIKCIAEVW